MTSKAKTPKKRNREAAKKRIQKSKLLHAALHALYPKLFDVKNPVPLAIGIDKQICKAFPGASRKSVRRFLRWWCTRHRYVKVRDAGGERMSLEG